MSDDVEPGLNASETPDPNLIEALRERLEHHKNHPDEVSTWEEVRARVLARKTNSHPDDR
jgi:hypothetical protein